MSFSLDDSYGSKEPEGTENVYRGQSHPYPLSGYQKAIVDFVLDKMGNLVVNAVAGSGKTSTLKALASYMTVKVLFLAFNKHIATELSEDLKGTTFDCSTIHSRGYGVLRKRFGSLKLEAQKYRRLCALAVDLRSKDRNPGRKEKKLLNQFRRMIHTEQQETVLQQERTNTLQALSKLVDLARLNLIQYSRDWTKDQLYDLCEHYEIDIHRELEDWACYVVPAILRYGLAATNDNGEIDFTDMIWIPGELNLRPYPYSFVFVDEAQDLSPCQLRMALSCVHRKGRVIAVGDRNQSIYGFAGADVDSIDRIIDRIDATELPLSICYRCPRSVVEIASKIVPDIEPYPCSEEGTIGTVDPKEISKQLSEGDIVVCRTTAPLVKLCFDLIRQGIAARVRGRDIGKQIINTLIEISDQPGFRFRRIEDEIDSWERKKARRILERTQGDQDDPGIQAIMDRAECLRVFLEMTEAETIEALEDGIEDLFSDQRPAIWLSTVHKVKGLEADNVFILRPELLPFPYARLPWQQQQESNLEYVAYTRAKKALYFIDSDAPQKDTEDFEGQESEGEASFPTRTAVSFSVQSGHPQTFILDTCR